MSEEQKIGIRKWCVERVGVFVISGSTEDLITEARKLELYVFGISS